MGLAVANEKVCCRRDVATYLFGHSAPLLQRKETHTSCRKKINGGLWHCFAWYFFKRDVEQGRKMQRSDILGRLCEGGNAGPGFLGVL